MIAVMVGALAQIVPDLVAGDLFRTSFHNLVGGIHPRTRRQFVHYEWASGGNGAFAEDDGPSAMASIDWVDLNTVQPTEVLESRFPLVIESSAMATDSGGDGRRRGGLAMRRELRLTGPEAAYSVLGDGAVVPAFGVLGGRSGVPIDAHVRRNGETLAFPTPGKVSGFRMVRDDVLVLQSAGGGGHGDPLDREPERVAVDVREGLVSPSCARDVYGVVLWGEALGVDVAATSARREALRRSRFCLTVLATDSPQYEAGSVSRRRIARLHPTDAAHAGFAAGTLVELVGAHVPLRAWVLIDEAVPVGSVPADELARRVLGVVPGALLEIRAV